MATQLLLAPVGLEELNRQASFQSRIDSKYLVPASFAENLPRSVPAATRVLQIGAETKFAYQSIYFDTPDLLTYRMSAHRRRRRFKVRTRAYVSSDLAFLEVKIRGVRGVTDKVRIPHEPDRLDCLSADDLAFVRETLGQTGMDSAPVDNLSPYLTTGYQRVTYLTAGWGDQVPVRTTVDSGLYWEQMRDSDLSPAMLFRPGLSVIETKSSAAANRVNQLLWHQGVRPAPFSKYCTGAAALDPRLPANKWHRQLQELLGDGS